jgi:hypothetical protein
MTEPDFNLFLCVVLEFELRALHLLGRLSTLKSFCLGQPGPQSSMSPVWLVSQAHATMRRLLVEMGSSTTVLPICEPGPLCHYKTLLLSCDPFVSLPGSTIFILEVSTHCWFIDCAAHGMCVGHMYTHASADFCLYITDHVLYLPTQTLSYSLSSFESSHITHPLLFPPSQLLCGALTYKLIAMCLYILAWHHHA